MSKKLTVPEVLKAYKIAERFKTDNDMADALSLSRQVLSHWMTERHAPTNEWLRSMAIVYRSRWQGDMAVDLLKLRKQDIPCICLEMIGDNGPCPKHGIQHAVVSREELGVAK